MTFKSPKTWPWFKIIVFTGFSFSLGFFKEYNLPQLKKLTLVKIETFSKKHGPVRVWPQKMELEFFPLGVSFHKVKILPKKELAKNLAALEIGKVTASISLLELIQGKFRLSQLSITEANINWIQKSSSLLNKMANTTTEELKRGSSELKLELDWDQIYKIPVDELKLENIHLQARVTSPEVSAQINDLSLSVYNRYKAILISTKTPKLLLKKTKADPILDLALETKLLVEEKGIRVSAVKIYRQKSFVVASGILSGDSRKLKFSDAKIKARSHFQLKEIQDLVHQFFPKILLPKLRGIVDLDTEILDINGIDSKIGFKLNTKNVTIEGFELDQLSTKGVVQNKSFSFEKFRIKNRSGSISAPSSRISLGDKIDFEMPATVENLEVSKLLQTLTLPKIPLNLEINGSLPCKGTITPSFGINCEPNLTGTNLIVNSGLENDSTNIVTLREFKASGPVTVNDKKVTYKATVSIGNSKNGRSNGEISYAKGFDISYSGENLDFGDIENIGNLGIKGLSKLQGRTQGDSNSAIFNINGKFKRAWLDGFYLGENRFQLNYKKGQLFFKNIKGRINNTRYTGQVRVDLNKERISVDGRLPFIDVDDIEKSVAKKWQLPFQMTGTGSADIKVNGPFDVLKLDFDLKSKLFRGRVAGESFDQANISLYGKNQNITTRNISIQKGDSYIDLKGTISPNGTIDGVAVCRSLRLEQSEIISGLNLNLSGVMDASAKFSGVLSNPKVGINGRISQMVVGDQQAEDSYFNLGINKSEVSGSGQFIGNVVETKFQIPINSDKHLKLYVKTNKWNFSQAFNVFANVAFKQDYDTNLTSESFFESPTGKLIDGKGKVFVEDFLIRRGPVFMTSNGPSFLEIDKGRFKTKNFKLSGQGTFLELISRETDKSSPLNLSLKGKVDLSLATLLTPFLDDLRGTASLNIDSAKNLFDPEITGSVYLQGAKIQIPGLPHAIDAVNSDILFNKKSVLVNSVKGSFADGKFSAEGRANFKSIKRIPVDFKAHFDNVSLNIPDGFNTIGHGDVTITGETFPYTLGGHYYVEGGSVKKDFDAKTETIKKIKPSDFLPKFLSSENFSPLLLNIHVTMNKSIPVDVIMTGTEIKTPVIGKLKVTNTPDNPLLTGKITTTGKGGFTFRSNEFDIQHATIIFNDAPPDNPELNVAAQTRIQDIDINLTVVGKAKDLKVGLTSQPSLPEGELLNLIAIGMTTQDADKNLSGEKTAEQTSLQITSAIINQQLGLGKEIKKKLGVDFEIATDFDPEEATNVHRVTFKKQWTPQFGASASRSIGDKPVNKFRLEYKLSDGLSLIGNYENKEDTDNNEETEDKMGLDLEYKVEFGK